MRENNKDIGTQEATPKPKKEYINGIPVRTLAVFYSSPSEWVENVEQFISNKENNGQQLKEPTFSVGVDMLNGIKDSPPDTHRGKWEVLGLFAIRSIGGQKHTFRTNYLMVFARMAGHASAKGLDIRNILKTLGVAKPANAKNLATYYGGRYLKPWIMERYDKVHILSANGLRGIWVMQNEELTREQALEELALIAFGKTSKAKQAEIKDTTRRAIEKARARKSFK